MSLPHTPLATVPQLSTETDNEYNARVRAMLPASQVAEIQATEEELAQITRNLADMGADSAQVEVDFPANHGSVCHDLIT
jgi:hypothetical protein